MDIPRHVLEIIANFADHDTRRALGFKPRKLCPSLKAHMEFLIKRKLDCQFKEYYGKTTTIFITDKKDSTNVSAVYICIDHNIDSMNMIHITGQLGYSENRVWFSTHLMSRGVTYTIFDPYDISPLCVVGQNGGLSTGVTAYNFKILNKI